MGAISRPEFVTCLWPEATRFNKSEGTAHGEIACPKIGTGPNFIPKREIKKKCAAFSAHFFLLWSKATIFLCHIAAISWLQVIKVVCGLCNEAGVIYLYCRR